MQLLNLPVHILPHILIEQRQPHKHKKQMCAKHPQRRLAER